MLCWALWLVALLLSNILTMWNCCMYQYIYFSPSFIIVSSSLYIFNELFHSIFLVLLVILQHFIVTSFSLKLVTVILYIHSLPLAPTRACHYSISWKLFLDDQNVMLELYLLKINDSSLNFWKMSESMYLLFYYFFFFVSMIFERLKMTEEIQTCLPVPIFAGHTDFGPQSRFPDFMRWCTDFGRCGNL